MALINWTNTEKVLQEYGNYVINEYRNSLINDNRVATKNLINDLSLSFVSNNYKISVSLKLWNYWQYVEWDTKPHFPPINAIVEWVKAKPILPDEKTRNLPDDKRTLSTAFAVAHKIDKEGTKGTHNLRDTLEEVNELYTLKIEQAVAEDLTDSINVLISEFFRK